MTSVRDPACLALRLGGPLQSWGSASDYNRRDTDTMPTKSGVIGLLAAADGRRREDPIVDLLALRLGVRVDQPGTLLRDYHTVSDYRGRPLLSASVDARRRQVKTAPAKYTAVTERFYLQDAIFVAVVAGDSELMRGLAKAVTRPAFPLALGRRCCVPTQPLLLRSTSGDLLWDQPLEKTLGSVPWQASWSHRRRFREPTTSLLTAYDSDVGTVRCTDVPTSFAHRSRSFTTRRIVRDSVVVSTGRDAEPSRAGTIGHDPFTLLGW
jgi:CRISPR system Cascade subunit CasD